MYEENGKGKEWERKGKPTRESSGNRAVELLNTSGKSGTQIEAELGVGNGVVYRRRPQLQEGETRAFPGNGNVRDKELAELRKENAELREEKEILRKAIAIFSDRRRK